MRKTVQTGALTCGPLTFARGLPAVLRGRRLLLRPERSKLQRRKHCVVAVAAVMLGSRHPARHTTRARVICFTGPFETCRNGRSKRPVVPRMHKTTSPQSRVLSARQSDVDKIEMQIFLTEPVSRKYRPDSDLTE